MIRFTKALKKFTAILQKRFYFIILITYLISGLPLRSQTYYDFGFVLKHDISVFDTSNNLLDLAWIGGLNTCQFHKFDLNSDQIEDLIIFDRHGNRLLTFVNDGSDSEYAYSFAPEYIDKFPKTEQWIQFVDYDNDGKKDIFTYVTGGMKVYQNISDTSIRFKKITDPYLYTQLSNHQLINLFVTSVDYPAIVDIDNDSDVDILTFWGLGTFLEKHSNQSVELYGHSDSLIFKKTEYCWGYFAESEESNIITLDTCIDVKNMSFLPEVLKNREERHTGSTLLMLDMTGNGLYDLILGDIDFPGLFLLKNGGTADSAYIVDCDTLFPSNTRPVNLFSFPLPCFIDIDNDGINDLVVSPFEPGMKRAKHHNCVWYYKNTGTNSHPVFEFEREDLFQHRMIDVGANAMPVLYDINGDGLPDLFVGNYGYNDTCYYDQFYIMRCKYSSKLAYFKNTGTPGNPSFQLMTDDFADLSAYNLRGIYPAFGDIDNDGKIEMLIGNEDGNLLLFKNTAAHNEPFEFELIDDNYQQIKVNAFSAPQLIDLNSNGLPDLVLGQQNGRLSYYENQGDAYNPLFVKITDTLGGVNVTDEQMSYTGHSIPCFFRDSKQELKLFIGSESGRVFYFKDIENNLTGIFTLVDERLTSLNEGIRTAPAVAYLTDSIYPDMIIGNYGGGLTYHKGVTPEAHGISGPHKNNNFGFDLYPNPSSDYLILLFDNEINIHKAQVQIFDILGRTVYSSNNLTKPCNHISVSNWNNGTYIVSVKFEDSYGKIWWSRKKAMVLR